MPCESSELLEFINIGGSPSLGISLQKLIGQSESISNGSRHWPVGTLLPLLLHCMQHFVPTGQKWKPQLSLIDSTDGIC